MILSLAPVVSYQIFHLMQNKGEKIQLFASRLKEVFSHIQSQFPHLVHMEDEGNHLRDRLFHGMHKTLHDSIHYLYDDAKVSYIQLLIAARKTETEVSDVKGTIKSSLLGSVQEREIESLTKQITILMSVV